MKSTVLLLLLLAAGSVIAQTRPVDARADKQPFGVYATAEGAIPFAPEALSSQYLPGLGGGVWAGLRFRNQIEVLLGVEFLSFAYDGTLQNAEGGAFKPLLYTGYVKYYPGPPRRGSMRPFGMAGVGVISLAFNDIRRDGIAIQGRETRAKPLLGIGGGADIELSDQTTLTLLGRVVVFEVDDDLGVMVPIAIGFRFAP